MEDVIIGFHVSKGGFQARLKARRTKKALGNP